MIDWTPAIVFFMGLIALTCYSAGVVAGYWTRIRGEERRRK